MIKRPICVVPAILAKNKEEFENKIKLVPDAHTIQIDIMDGKFVDNTTYLPEDFSLLPLEKEIEYHLMVKDPFGWIEELPNGSRSIFQVHVETITEYEIEDLIDLINEKNSKLCFALNPDTPVDILKKFPDTNHVLIMTVHPGKSGQKYIKEVEEKIKKLRKLKPQIDIEIDGGANEKTSLSAIAAGANKIAIASEIFNYPNPNDRYNYLKNLFNQI